MDTARGARRPKKTQKDLRREATRAALIDAARRLFSEFGYDGVAVTDIAREAGVSHSMINVYFNGKAGLLYEIVKDLNGPQMERTRQIARSTGGAAERISQILRAWLDFDLRDARLLAVLQSYSWVWPPETEAENQQTRASFEAELAHVIGEGQADGTFGRRIDPALAAEAIWALYTWASRAAVFEEYTQEQCHERLRLQVDALLGAEG